MSNLLPPFHKPMDSPMQCHLANDKIAELEADAAELAARKLCGRHCPACVEFTTVFTMPKVEYLGCLRKQSESTKLLNQTAAPIGQPCPYRIVASGEPDCDNCPQPHDEYNEPDCDACDAAWSARAEMVPARGPYFGDGVWERRQDNPPGLGLINDVIPPDRVEDGEE